MIQHRIPCIFLRPLNQGEKMIRGKLFQVHDGAKLESRQVTGHFATIHVIMSRKNLQGGPIIGKIHYSTYLSITSPRQVSNLASRANLCLAIMKEILK